MFLTHNDFKSEIEINFEEDTLREYDNLSKELKFGLKDNNSVIFDSLEREVVEDEQFWKKVGKLLSNENKVELFSFDTRIYKDRSAMFEENVLKKLQTKVKIGIYDWKQKSDESDEVKEWMKNYNIQYYRSHNSSCLHNFVEAKQLKVIYLRYFHSCEEKVLNIFLELKYLHSLKICFDYGVKINNEVVKNFFKTVEEEDLYPGEINFRTHKNRGIESEMTHPFNQRKKEKSFVIRVNKRLNEDKSKED